MRKLLVEMTEEEYETFRGVWRIVRMMQVKIGASAEEVLSILDKTMANVFKPNVQPPSGPEEKKPS